MAKASSGKGSAPSRIRFVMVEAELGDGDIGQITQAIQNALRVQPLGHSIKRIASAPPVNPAGQVSSDEDEETEDQSDLFEGVVEPAASKPRAVRKLPPTPDIVAIDMNSEVSLASFIAGKDTKSQHKKYLVAAAWLKEHRDIDAVSAGHIYTCFRSAGWATNIPDFWQPLRDLKAKKYFGKNDQGEYEINHIGLDFVKKLGGGA